MDLPVPWLRIVAVVPSVLHQPFEEIPFASPNPGLPAGAGCAHPFGLSQTNWFNRGYLVIWPNNQIVTQLNQCEDVKGCGWVNRRL
jgi:hypothetical protein